MNEPPQLEAIRHGSKAWNRWRRDNPGAALSLKGVKLPHAKLSGANLNGVDLSGADLSGADIRMADLRKANLNKANLDYAILSLTDMKMARLIKASLVQANFVGAHLDGAKLSGANLSWAHLDNAIIRRANLTAANLTGVRLTGCNLEGSDLTGSTVYGVSVWDTKLASVKQRDLIITSSGQPPITVDNLEVAQFVYLLLNNARVRDVIDTITSKAVLILGRFTPERKQTLDAMRDMLRDKNYLPIVFDFEKPLHRDYTETVSTLAHLARFVIADLTDPRSVPQELTAIAPRLLSVPIRPLLLGSQQEWAMFNDLTRYPQVIAPFHYSDDAMLLSRLDSDVIGPAERRAHELAGK